jgi:hypothetical protein
VTIDGSQATTLTPELVLDKTRETHFVTFSKAEYAPSTIAFDRKVNPFWPVADLIWGPGFPIAWLVDWTNGSVYRIDPRDLNVVLRQP